ncbi:Calpain-2 catalytic subunit [Liparis tanakae]|uniref:Calpain-2 catalytic subunit n=1 Tax=Liparis tanakae TaxID=230148 RepID=A0A4Z2IAF2_9TELE|nr:Calpain-2 catalytic subunit [Liparis tanakae]
MTSTADRLAHQKEREEGIGTNQKAVKFSKQDYVTLRQQCLERGCLFEDNCFPAESKSLGFKELGPYSSKTRHVVWKRPTFWQFGEWVDVVVDDRLPTRDGKLLFVHSAEGSEFWSALLEKAYSKVHGCYEALSGGNTIEGFEDFTGGIAEVYPLAEAPTKLFHVIQRALSLGSLLGCSIDITNAYETEAVTALKLVKGHAYSVTGAQEVSFGGRPVQLVRIRNPWGQVEWTGPWSDGMSYSDFIKQFSKLEICNLTPDTLMSDDVRHWNNYQFEGMWRVGSTAGGCRNNPATYSSNPQFVVRLEDVDDDPLDGEDGCTFLVGLMQKDGRRQKRLDRNLETIGFAIYEYKGCSNVHLGPDVLLRQKAVARSSNFINTREVCDRFKLPPGEYAIVPSTFEPHKKGSFVLRVFSEKKAATSPLEVDVKSQIEEEEVSEKDVDPHFKKLFKQIAGKEIFKTFDQDNSGTMSSHEMRGAAAEAGFQVNNTVLQSIVNRYADAQYAIDFDSFVGCLIKLEMLFKIFKALDRADKGKMELDIQQWLCLAIY